LPRHGSRRSLDRNVIEIPGYRVLRQLGRGGMATVYLALQQSVDREVALKVMSPALLADPNFGERFLREARIAAKLHHRHVVGVHDVGRHGDHHYIAMEYLSGGSLLAKQGSPRPVTFALRAMREIAQALHYAHAKGFVHRDVKPDNILLRDDSSSALTDFGIARANDSTTRMTRTGAVIGTPHYMSPEQARGRAMDGRADLYSLGIVLHEALVGRVPYHADDSLAVGIMHITEPLPKLPRQIDALQSLLDRLLAKQPEERFQSGSDLADAIEEIEVAIARGDLPDLAVPDEAYKREILGADTPRYSSAVVNRSTPEPAATTTFAAARTRSEPSIGRMEEALVASERRFAQSRGAARRAESGSKRWIVWALLLAIALGGAFAAFRYQDKLRALLVPNTQLNELIVRGQKALAAGKLTGTQNDSARELFQAARILDADNEQARIGLTRVGERLIEQARTAIARGDFIAANAAAVQAREVLAGGAEVEKLDGDLRNAQQRNTATDQLLVRAGAAFAAGQLLGENGAMALYKSVLDADAANGTALNGLKRIGEALVIQAREAIGAGKIDIANQRIEDLTRLAPNNPAIPELRGEIARARSDDTSAIEQTLTRAEAQLRAGRFSGADDSAQALFHSVLTRSADNARAKAGLRKVAQALLVQANAALDANNPSGAEKLLQQTESLAPDLPDLRPAKSRLRELREQIDIANKKPQVSPADLARIPQMLEDANRALLAGNLIVPPGESAYDQFRGVLRMDRNNTQATEGLQRIPARARELFESALKDSPNKARGLYDALSETSPGDAALSSMRERLAEAYLDVANARIADGRRVDAERALKNARELSPANTRLGAIEQKLREMPEGG
jgi:serine/threonine-protein kinase PpkA